MTETHRSDVAYARERDRHDPLSAFREQFHLPGELYLDGNSLGPISDPAKASLDRAIEQWRDLGIDAWTEADPPWFYYGEALGDTIAPLIGASGEEVVVANSTTVNIHTLLGSFLTRREDDQAMGILANELDFPTDHYAIRAQLRQRGLDPQEHFHTVESQDGRTIATADIIEAMEARDVGIVFLPSVLYRSGQLLDIARITEEAHERDMFVGFDIAHSIGVVPHDFASLGVDFAVWCSYKYLNAGPGAIAGLYVNRAHFDTTPALPGWWGHRKDTQFEMNLEYTPAADAGRWQIGTIPIFSAAPLWGSLELIRDAGIEAVRAKSLQLTDYLMYLADAVLAEYGCEIVTPRKPDQRGGHVGIAHPAAAQLSQALRDRGAIVDFRPPDVVRVCPAPFYIGYEDIWVFVQLCRDLLETEAYNEYEVPGDGVT